MTEYAVKSIVDMCLIDLRRWVAMIEHENLIAEREQANGGWLSDHSETIHQYNREYVSVQTKLEEALRGHNA